MLVTLREFFREEKGQGLVEYALILAFVAVLAYMMFKTSGMQSDVTSTFSNAQSKIKVAASNLNK